MNEQRSDYDSPWKEILERYFEEFMAFFFPTMYQGIDWSKEYQFLDKELQQIVRDAELGRRLVDKLVEVYTTNGDAAWVLIHVEVQGKAEDDFAKRMYVYNYRLFDRYDRKVASIALLTDNQKSWRPDTFEYTLWDCKVLLKFSVVKLLDWQDRDQELQQSTNPFAIVILAYLKTQATKKHPDDRFQWKFRLFKMLYEKGYSKEDILELTRFIDWIMVLPEELEQRFEETVLQFEEEQRMQYVASFERIWLKRGMEQGRQKGLEQGLEKGLEKGIQKGHLMGLLEKSREDNIDILRARFEKVPRVIIAAINDMDDLFSLKELLKKAATVRSLDEFQALPEIKEYQEFPNGDI